MVGFTVFLPFLVLKRQFIEGNGHKVGEKNKKNKTKITTITNE